MIETRNAKDQLPQARVELLGERGQGGKPIVKK